MSSGWNPMERGRVFDEIPSGVVVLDPDLRVVDQNRPFTDVFGDARGQTCYRVTKGRETPCDECPALAAFDDGRARAVEQYGTDQRGRNLHYLVQVSPLTDASGRRAHVAAITTDLTRTRQLQHEYQTLFEKVPCFVAVINREHRVVKANEAFRRVFGEPTGEKCHSLYKKRCTACPECPVDLTFADGQTRSAHQMGVSRDGRPTPYLVFTAPLIEDEHGVSHVIEMALDMTEHQDLEEKLQRADALRSALVEESFDAIIVFDEEHRSVLANRTAERFLGLDRRRLGHSGTVWKRVPRELRPVIKGHDERMLVLDASLEQEDGSSIPVRAGAVRLDLDGRFMGSAVFLQDLRERKRLEHDKMEAERLAAVGQTVAGLAHGIKNIITGLEGGMYVTSSGMKKGDEARVKQGWEMLVRNMGRISDLTRNLLAFSRGETLECNWTRPDSVAEEVIDLYRDAAARQGVTLVAEVQHMEPAWMDGEALHSCLANLVSNAVDACLSGDEGARRVVLRAFEERDALVFEVSDTGCGMSFEVKRKVFTSFFTTKGRGGTGLGLLMTRKIVQQHGGSIDFESSAGDGTTFRIEFPRDRLPARGGDA
jgi:PAS domain S-box-containing protein